MIAESLVTIVTNKQYGQIEISPVTHNIRGTEVRRIVAWRHHPVT
jgi:hypothetical protein